MTSERPGFLRSVPTLTEEIALPKEIALPRAAADPAHEPVREPPLEPAHKPVREPADDPKPVPEREPPALPEEDPATPPLRSGPSAVAGGHASVAAPGMADQEQLTQRILADVQRQIDLVLEYRLREVLAPILTRATDALVRDARKELSSSLRDIVARSVAQELLRQRSR